MIFDLKIKNKNRNQEGFTLLEVLLSLGIVMTVIGAVLGVQLLVKNSYDFSLNSAVTVDHANGATDQMAKIIRSAQPAENGAFLVEYLADQELILYSNIDSDEDVEKVRFFLDGDELKRGVIEPSGFPVEYLTENEVIKVMTEYIQNGQEPIFIYYNQDWPGDQINNPLPLAERLEHARLVQINLKVNADEQRSEGEYELAPFVQLRNRKENL